jgi:hypothetical protein
VLLIKGTYVPSSSKFSGNQKRSAAVFGMSDTSPTSPSALEKGRRKKRLCLPDKKWSVHNSSQHCPENEQNRIVSMEILQTKLHDNTYRAEINSKEPIFVNFYNLLELNVDDNWGIVDLWSILDMPECPRPVNNRSSYNGGIWLYSQVVPFIIERMDEMEKEIRDKCF